MKTTTKAVAAGLLTLLTTTHLHGGTMTLVSFVETPTDFQSQWEWTNAGGNWAAAKPHVGQFWQVEMKGTIAAGGLGDLRDISRHIVNPHGGEILPPLSWWDYPGASNGFPFTVTWIDHPGMGHTDVYFLSAVQVVPGTVTILFDGDHLDLPEGDLRIPAPGSSCLLALAGLTTARRRR